MLLAGSRATLSLGLGSKLLFVTTECVVAVWSDLGPARLPVVPPGLRFAL